MTRAKRRAASRSKATACTPTVAPTCQQHGPMVQQEPGTPEQAFCGVWYRCTRCALTMLLQSEALTAQLAEQRAARRQEPRV
jgi:hypothetical protein